jgi:hypothetical protein
MNKSITTFILTPIIIGLFNSYAFSSEYYAPMNNMHQDGRMFAMGGARCGHEERSKSSVSLGYLLPFQLTSLSTRQLNARVNLLNMQVEGRWAQTGDESFLENITDLILSKKLSKNLLFTTGIGFYHFSPASGESGSIFFCEIGCNYQLTPKAQIEINLMNPTGAKIHYGANNVPTTRFVNGGIILHPIKSSHLLGELEWCSSGAAKGRFGVEYQFGETLSLRSGFSTTPLCPSWGLGGSFKRIGFAYGGNLHPVLGLSSGLTITLYGRTK